MRTELKLAVLAAAVALVACGKKEEAAAPATPAVADALVVKIGHVGATSGAVAHLGKDNENGARLAIEELNAAGMNKGNQTPRYRQPTMSTGMFMGPALSPSPGRPWPGMVSRCPDLVAVEDSR